MGVSNRIRPSSALVLLALSAASCLACAKGTEITPGEIVVLQLLPEGSDAGADAGGAPSEPPADEAAPVSTDAEP